MESLRNNITWMHRIIFGLFGICAGFFGYMVIFAADGFVASTYNERVSAIDIRIRRGSILDTNREILAESILNANGDYVRVYPFDGAFAHIVGFTARSQAGLELSRNFEISHLQWELLQRFQYAAFDTELEANSIITTFESSLQNLIYDGLSGGRGAAVAINPQNGHILAAVSSP
ncbi:MAG: hypothetical protein FWD01_03830, partial [Defluviitaleaceae bacterium]|nr:hypothetical protein [Defluviitaleaceae bacterium]